MSDSIDLKCGFHALTHDVENMIMRCDSYATMREMVREVAWRDLDWRGMESQIVELEAIKSDMDRLIKFARNECDIGADK